MTIRLIALWLLALAGLAGTPAGGWNVADARVAKSPDITAPAAAPRAENLTDGLRIEGATLDSDEADGAGDGPAIAPDFVEVSFRPPVGTGGAFYPRRTPSGLSVGHAFSARAPPSI